MKNEESAPRKKYRLNKRKLFGTLLALGLIIAAIIVATVSLMHEKAAAAVAEASDFPQAIITASSASVVTETSSISNDFSVVIDAGHGGFDPGCIGKSSVQEDDLNLAIALKLKVKLEDNGVAVILTREDENAIAETKEQDMAERRHIIEESGSDIVVSIHMNEFKDDPDIFGPLVLFMPGSEQGKTLAEALQQNMNAAFDTDGMARSEDLYILRSGNQPCALVECGYLSNEEEERKLQDEDYQLTIAQAICNGIFAYID